MGHTFPNNAWTGVYRNYLEMKFYTGLWYPCLYIIKNKQGASSVSVEKKLYSSFVLSCGTKGMNDAAQE